jgi:hypothetical protein
MLFALAEERKGRGDDLIAAYVIGIETQTRLAAALDFHDDEGRHPAFTLGTFAAAVAASHFLKLDPERVAAALAIAASLASRITVDVGAMTKPLLLGQCARNGLLAARLAEQGLDAVANASADHPGFFHVFNGGARSTSNDCSPIGAHHSRSRPQRHVVRSSGTNSKIVPQGIAARADCFALRTPGDARQGRGHQPGDTAAADQRAPPAAGEEGRVCCARPART